jgi:hypothetical protein
MRFITAFTFLAVALVVFFAPSKASAAQYVQITEPFVNVYAELNPKSQVIKMVKKGDRLELNYPGVSWYNVKIRDRDGWVESRAGRVVEGSDTLTLVLSIVLIIVLVAGATYGAVFFIRKQKTV